MRSFFQKCLYVALISMPLFSCEKEEPEVIYRQDVRDTKIIDEIFVVGGKFTLNSNNSRVVKVITLPQKTKYWVFWFGVGQEARQKYLETVNSIPKGVRHITTDPVVALGLEMIKSINLAANSGSDNIDSFFAASYLDSDKFTKNKEWKRHIFFDGTQTVNTYMVKQIEDTPLDSSRNLYMTFENFKSFRDLDVQLKVWAFTEK